MWRARSVGVTRSNSYRAQRGAARARKRIQEKVRMGVLGAGAGEKSKRFAPGVSPERKNPGISGPRVLRIGTRVVAVIATAEAVAPRAMVAPREASFPN